MSAFVLYLNIRSLQMKMMIIVTWYIAGRIVARTMAMKRPCRIGMTDSTMGWCVHLLTCTKHSGSVTDHTTVTFESISCFDDVHYVFNFKALWWKFYCNFINKTVFCITKLTFQSPPDNNRNIFWYKPFNQGVPVLVDNSGSGLLP